jgi:hypothetical protein
MLSLHDVRDIFAFGEDTTGRFEFNQALRFSARSPESDRNFDQPAGGRAVEMPCSREGRTRAKERKSIDGEAMGIVWC